MMNDGRVFSWTAWILGLALSLGLVGGVPAAQAQTAVPGSMPAYEASSESPPHPHDDDEQPFDGGGYFAIGTHVLDLSSLNDRLSAAAYPTFEETTLSLGGGGYGIVGNRFMLGGEGHGLITPSRGLNGRTVSLAAGYGLATFGYLVPLSDRFFAFPQVGAGGGALTLDIGSAGAEEFDDVLGDPNRSASLEKASFLLSLGGGLTYQIGGRMGGDSNHEDDEKDGFRLGIRAGYLIAPFDTDWRHAEDRLSGGPDASLSGPFVRLTLGGG